MCNFPIFNNFRTFHQVISPHDEQFCIMQVKALYDVENKLISTFEQAANNGQVG